jgi:penicillin-binding protein 1A
MAESSPENVRYRLRREAGGALNSFRETWRAKRWLRWLSYLVGAGFLLYFLIWVTVARNLPSAEKLLDYQPPLPTMVRGVNGEIVYSYARERRVQLRFVDFPRPVYNAFLAAEDKTFWSHGGVDYTGLAGAVIDYATKFGSGERARGGSTITQQVAKNILIGDEYSITRKLKEMILARRIEAVLNKQQILELYLNEIPLGRQAFGVQAASRAYFDKDIDQLDLHEAAFLAILPKAPERYGRAKFAQMAIARRNYVLDQMQKNGWASAADAAKAKAEPLDLVARRNLSYNSDVGYFVEEVRRRLIAQYGETADSGPNSIYAGGLWVRTSLDPELQKAAQDSLRDGLLRYASGKGWHKPIAHIDIDPDRWQTQLVTLNKSISYKDWRVGIVVRRDGADGTIGFTDGSTARLTGLPDPVTAGDVIAAAPLSDTVYAVKTLPEVAGGMVVEDPTNGRVLAMQGGFDPGLDSFNRATQAERQPGSTIKPFVYATALDYGMTPATMVPDQTFCVAQNNGQKCFRNFDARGSGGIHTMRWGLEQSRNLMTVHIASDAGMDHVVRTMARFGIGNYKPYFSFALGAGETTVQQMVNAYAALANYGVQHNSTLIDFIQDRNGKIIWRADNRHCGSCNMGQWDGKPMPRLAPRGKQVLDPRTAYQTVHMLEGVVTRGTAVRLRDLGLPLFGKTGTTSGPTNVWFVGGSQNLIGGVYIGYDQPRSLGGYAQGGTFAAPIMKQFIETTKPRWSHVPFAAPAGVHMIKVDRITGKKVFSGSPTDDPKSAIIWEAFKAETEPDRTTRRDELTAQRNAVLSAVRRVGQAHAQAKQPGAGGAEPGNFAEQQGGVY